MTREQIEAEIAGLKAKNEAAPGWGAAVGARSERIKGLEQALRAMDRPQCSAESCDQMRRIILGLFNPMPDGHPKGCLANENGPCQCGYAETAGKYLWALREAKKIAAEHYGKKEVEESRRMEEPAGLVEASALVATDAQPTVEPVAWLYEEFYRGGWSQRYSDAKPFENKLRRNFRPLYLASQPSPAATVETDDITGALNARQAAINESMARPRLSAETAEALKRLHAYILHNYGAAASIGGKALENFETNLSRQFEKLAALTSTEPQPVGVPQEEDCGCIGAVIGQHERSCPLPRPQSK